MDFVDGLFAVSRSVLAALSVNRARKAAARNIEQMFGKILKSQKASGDFKELNPKTGMAEKASRSSMIS